MKTGNGEDEHFVFVVAGLDTTIDKKYSPIYLQLFIELHSNSMVNNTRTIILRGGDKTIDLADIGSVESYVDDILQDGSYNNEIAAKLGDNVNFSDEQIDELINLCEESDFSYKVVGAYPYEADLPSDFGKNIKELAILFKEMQHLSRGEK